MTHARFYTVCEVHAPGKLLQIPKEDVADSLSKYQLLVYSGYPTIE